MEKPKYPNFRPDLEYWQKKELQDNITILRDAAKKMKKWLQYYNPHPEAEAALPGGDEVTLSDIEQMKYNYEDVTQHLVLLQDLLAQPLPDRELSMEEKTQVYQALKNTVREDCGESPIRHRIAGYYSPPDSEIGRRLQALFIEAQSIMDAILPTAAKDETYLADPNYTGPPYWKVKNQWAKDVARDCQHCGSVCEVHEWAWDRTSQEIIDQYAKEHPKKETSNDHI